MTSYESCLGSPITVLSAADQTGANKGNLTAAFTTNVLGTMPPVFEWYHAVIDTATGALFTPANCPVMLNIRKPATVTYPAGSTEWDPSQPILMRSGDELFFFWQLASNVTPVPRVTCYFRYDADLRANQGYRG